MTLEQLAYESELGSKGHLSDIEHGLVCPTIKTLKSLADRLEVLLLDLVTFPEGSQRQELIDRTRQMNPKVLKAILLQIRSVAPIGDTGDNSG